MIMAPEAAPGTQAAFERDVAAFAGTPRGWPVTRMRMRWEAIYDVERVLPVPVRGSLSYLRVWLYADTAKPRSRPLFNFFVDAAVDLGHVRQGDECTVEGSLEVGRAVRVSVGGTSFVSGTQLASPVLAAARGPRLGA